MGIIQTTKTLRPREQHDFYPTPVELVREALKLIDISYVCYVLDPGAGSGVWGEEYHKIDPTAIIAGVDIREIPAPLSYDAWYCRNFLDADFNLGSDFHLIIGNPPYKYAEQFVRKSYDSLIVGGQMLFLLRLAFLEGQKRAVHFWPKYKPKKVTVLGRRPSFTGDHKTDATAYMLCLWEKGYSGDTTLDWLKWDYDKSK